MKIVFLASGSVNSSLSARAINFGRELVKNGHDVVMIAPASDKYTSFRKERIAELDGIKIIQPKQFNTRSQVLNFIPYIPAVTWHAWCQKADIIHLYKPTPLTIAGLIGRCSRKTKVILDMDDLGSEVMQREGNAHWKVYLVSLAERLAARYSNSIITASSYLQSYYIAKYPRKPVLWVPNGVKGLAPGLSKDTPSIVFIGSLNNLEIITPLIKALPKVIETIKPKNPILQIIGDGDKIPELESLIAKLSLSDSITLSGWIKTDELRQYVTFGSLGYCCVPNDKTYKAASSQKIFNYLSMGIVPVVNRVGDLPYYVENGTSGYIVNNNLAPTLISALKDHSDITKKLRAGRTYLEANFLWSNLAKKIESFYVQQSKVAGGDL